MKWKGVASNLIRNHQKSKKAKKISRDLGISPNRIDLVLPPVIHRNNVVGHFWTGYVPAYYFFLLVAG